MSEKRTSGALTGVGTGRAAISCSLL